MEQFNSASLLIPEIKELLGAQKYALVKQVLRECNPMDFAELWKKFSEAERLQIFRLLPAISALKLFEILDIENQRYLVGKLNEESVTPILENMPSPDLAKLFHKTSPRLVKKMTGLIKRQDALAHVDLILQYPRNTAGSLMHPEFVRLSPKLTAKQALQRLQAIVRPNQKEYLNSLYVTDDGKVMGTLTLQELVAAPEDEKLYELMDSIEGIKIKPETDQEEVSKIFSKYHLNSAPVVDDNGRLIGILTLSDILSVMRQEATEDIAKMAGTQAHEMQEKSVFRIVGFRMPWLIATLCGGVISSFVIKFHEPLLARIIALASFSPLIAGMGGNVGSQSAIVVVRSLTLGQIKKEDRVKAVFREMRVGLLLGIIYGILLGVIAYVIYGERYHADFSYVVAIGMCTSMTVAATLGAAGPIMLERFGIDPATATGPVITTLTDLITVTTYLSLAAVLLASF